MVIIYRGIMYHGLALPEPVSLCASHHRLKLACPGLPNRPQVSDPELWPGFYNQTDALLAKAKAMIAEGKGQVCWAQATAQASSMHHALHAILAHCLTHCPLHHGPPEHTVLRRRFCSGRTWPTARPSPPSALPRWRGSAATRTCSPPTSPTRSWRCGTFLNA